MPSKRALSRSRRTGYENDLTVHGVYESRDRSPQPCAPLPGINTRVSPAAWSTFELTFVATICYSYNAQTSGRRRAVPDCDGTKVIWSVH